MADIELVVKIDTEDYKEVLDINNRDCNWNNMHSCYEAILNGIPLPKGHGDLKDQKDLAKSLYDYQWIDQLTYMEVTNRLISAPTIIEADKEQE